MTPLNVNVLPSTVTARVSPAPAIVTGFAELLKPMVETVDRHGLKARFLRKHQTAVDRFFRFLDAAELNSETALKCKQRLKKNRDTLFTFLRYDGVP